VSRFGGVAVRRCRGSEVSRFGGVAVRRRRGSEASRFGGVAVWRRQDSQRCWSRGGGGPAGKTPSEERCRVPDRSSRDGPQGFTAGGGSREPPPMPSAAGAPSSARSVGAAEAANQAAQTPAWVTTTKAAFAPSGAPTKPRPGRIGRRGGSREDLRRYRPKRHPRGAKRVKKVCCDCAGSHGQALQQGAAHRQRRQSSA
jgi:hypothetical protein